MNLSNYEFCAFWNKFRNFSKEKPHKTSREEACFIRKHGHTYGNH